MRKSKLLIALSALMLMTAMLATPVSAGSNNTTLSNGAELAVSIDDPITCTEFLIQPNEDTIDVDIEGTASVGVGEPGGTFVYVIDVSGSTDIGEGTGCSPILGCEQEFIVALNEAVILDGSTDEVGVVVYADSAETADMKSDPSDQIITAPDTGELVTVVNSTYSDKYGGDGGVAQYTDKKVGQRTNYAAGVAKALDVVNASSNPFASVVFLSDGIANEGSGSFAANVAALAATDAVVNSIAVGNGSQCNPPDSNPHGELWEIAVNGGTCYENTDPGDLPDLIDNLTGTSLDMLWIAVDGGAAWQIPNADITPSLPQDGAISVDYDTPVLGLGPGDHEVCVTAYGSDVLGGMANVTQCEKINLLKLTLDPETAINELSVNDTHIVEATIVGDAIPGDVCFLPRDVVFEVTGINPEGPTDVPAVLGVAEFTYTVPVESDSLGSDTIQATTIIAGEETFVEVTKEWVDTTPPEAACLESTNPHGKIPPAPANGGQAQNPDGFYELFAEDVVWAETDLQVFVEDTGSGTVFGPFAVGTTIKYTEDEFATPEAKKIGSDKGKAKADAVDWHIIGNGDAALYAVDGSGNTSEPAMCLVPPPPK